AEDQGAAGRQSKCAGRISAEAKGNALAALLPPEGCARSSRQLQLGRVGRILPRAEGARASLTELAMTEWQTYRNGNPGTFGISYLSAPPPAGRPVSHL